MNRRSTLLILLIIVACLVLLTACGKKKAPAEAEPAPTDREEAAAVEEPPAPVEKEIDTEPFQGEAVDRGEPEPVARSVAELNRSGVLRTVYFDFDSAALGDDARATLRANADWLKANPDYRIVIEGHCDERGTIEYNLALGERRANTVREYLGSLGVPTSRARIVSYGEERPADPGHNEAAWAKNRRGEFVIE